MRRLAYAGLMIAVGLTGAYAESIPNFELLTLVAFLSGVLLGSRDGAAVGGLMALVFSLLNPYGPVHPIVTSSQVAGQVIAGAVGGGCAALAVLRRAARAGVLLGVGVLLTVCYDLLTNLATGVVFGQMRAVLIGGIPFALWHIATNALLFATAGTALVGALARYRARLSPSSP